MQSTANGGQSAYVLVTAAYNEAALIENTIKSVAEQTTPPLAWMLSATDPPIVNGRNRSHVRRSTPIHPGRQRSTAIPDEVLCPRCSPCAKA